MFADLRVLVFYVDDVNASLNSDIQLNETAIFIIVNKNCILTGLCKHGSTVHLPLPYFQSGVQEDNRGLGLSQFSG